MYYRTHPRRLVTLMLALGALCAAGCGVIGGGTAKNTSAGGKSATPVRAAGIDGPLQFADAKLKNLLLPRGAVPVGLTQAEEVLLSNDDVATFFPDAQAALQKMTESGRMKGGVAHYSLRSAPRASEPALAVSSSVAWYKTVAGAQSVIADPTMELVIHRLGLTAAEISMERVGQESRAFRGYRDGDDPDRAAYLLLFRKENVIGAVLVVVPSASDDGGKLALNLARRQAGVQLTSAAQ